MPKKYFKIELPDGSQIHVFFETASGIIVNFVVKLVIKYKSRYYEIVRFDTAHECPHKDILDQKGNILKKTWFEFLDNKQALDMAIKDLKDNGEMYIVRFKKWLKK